MTISAYFYWSTISFAELDELVSQLKDPTMDKNMKNEEEYILHFHGLVLKDSSVVGLSNQLQKLKGSLVKQVKLSNLKFTIVSRHGKIAFNGKSSRKEISFSELRKTNAWEQKKRDKFIKFWKEDFKHRMNKKQFRIAVATSVLGIIGLMFAYVAVSGSVISYITMPLLYESAGKSYSNCIDLLVLTSPFLVALCLALLVLLVENIESLNSYDRHLVTGKDSFIGFLLSHMSFWIELILIPIIILTYKDYQILNKETTLSYYFLTMSVDLTALAVLKRIIISLLLVISLSIIKNTVFSRIHVGRLIKRR
jgi:hypothetical protein